MTEETQQAPQISLTDFINTNMEAGKGMYDTLVKEDPECKGLPLIHLLLTVVNTFSTLLQKQGDFIEKQDKQLKGIVGEAGLALPLNARRRPSLVSSNGTPITSDPKSAA